MEVVFKNDYGEYIYATDTLARVYRIPREEIKLDMGEVVVAGTIKGDKYFIGKIRCLKVRSCNLQVKRRPSFITYKYC
jgi:hypothetical protein